MLYEVITKNYSSTYFNFIFASHSPFLLSDLQKQDCIFLSKNEKDKNDLEKKQTFGANIHTLLSDAFFMADGLQGKYSELIINELIGYLNEGKKTEKINSNEDAQKYINIMGEPILKRQLQKMLDSRRLSKIDEIDLLRRRIEELENKQK